MLALCGSDMECLFTYVYIRFSFNTYAQAHTFVTFVEQKCNFNSYTADNSEILINNDLK